MIRGLQKQILWLSTPKSRHFELVCFILRPERCRETPKDAEILREARSILLQAEPPIKERPPQGKKRTRFLFLLFFGGLLCGVLATLLGCALLGAL
ncbi:MAG: hypothetical protein IJD64_04610 [Clostridia bacterium]|nr:hypothetical protein [Clostridia bacterium]